MKEKIKLDNCESCKNKGKLMCSCWCKENICRYGVENNGRKETRKA
jgi:hypothetical protein